jgi:hypothetical protein
MKHISIRSFILILLALFFSTANSQSLEVLSSPEEEEAQSFGMNLITDLFHENYVYFKDDISNDISYYWCDPFDLECGGINHFKDTYSNHLHWEVETSMEKAEFTFFGPSILRYDEIDDFTGDVLYKESTNMYFQWTWVNDDGDIDYILFGFTLDENNDWKLTKIDNLPMN